MIVSAAGVILYSYSLGAFNSSSSLYQLQTSSREERARERFSIVAVWWDAASQLNLTILNYGRIDITIDAVYVNGTVVSNYISGKGTINGKSGLIRIKFTPPVTIESGRTYEILAVSQRGSKNAVYWKA
jgi:archaellum component FlaF (FlaF/FlaG flagellin family)